MARAKSRKALFVEAMRQADPRYRPHGSAQAKASFYSRLEAMTVEAFEAYVTDNASFLARMYEGWLDQCDDFWAECEYHKSKAYRAKCAQPWELTRDANGWKWINPNVEPSEDVPASFMVEAA